MLKSFRHLFAYFLAFSLLKFGFVSRARKRILKEGLILSIFFHDPPRTLFVACIKWLKRKGFHFISIKELRQYALGEISLPEGAVLLSIDDGWKGNLENVVDVVNDLQIPIALFVSTEPVEHGGGYWWSYVSKAKKLGISHWAVEALKKQHNDYRVKMLSAIRSSIFLEREAITKDELISIASSKYITIGSHTVTHPILPTCTDGAAEFEIFESKKKLEQWLSREVYSFSYPNGDYSQREIDLIKKAEFQIAFTGSPGYLTKDGLCDMYEVPRFEIFESASFLENICRMTGVWFMNKRLK
ncbi:MAG: polysaccharide deacetylase family protein [bacterium]|jgi:peptidoglycan/xylan/chitin deacetylase (PgdA/CDA1 family)